MCVCLLEIGIGAVGLLEIGIVLWELEIHGCCVPARNTCIRRCCVPAEIDVFVGAVCMLEIDIGAVCLLKYVCRCCVPAEIDVFIDAVCLLEIHVFIGTYCTPMRT